jgi:hypothetical protein
VATIAVHGGDLHVALPSSHQWLSLIALNDTGPKSAGAGLAAALAAAAPTSRATATRAVANLAAVATADLDAFNRAG